MSVWTHAEPTSTRLPTSTMTPITELTSVYHHEEEYDRSHDLHALIHWRQEVKYPFNGAQRLARARHQASITPLSMLSQALQ